MSMERAMQAVRRASLEWIQVTLASESVDLEAETLLSIAEAKGVPVEWVVEWIRAPITVERSLVSYRRWACGLAAALKEVPRELW
jgi:hypothetical protein